MKRIMSCVMVLLLVCTLFGCSSSSDSETPIVGTWIMTHEGKGDKIYETKKVGLTLNADGTTNGDRVWLLQADYLTIGDRRHYVKSLTKDELIITEKEDPNGGYFIYKRESKGFALDEAIKIDEDDVVGLWAYENSRRNTIEFSSNGTGYIMSGDGDVSFRWSIQGGNRLVMVRENGKIQIYAIMKCTGDTLEVWPWQKFKRIA